MNFLRNNLANFFTLGNLFSGCVGAVHLLNGDYQTTAICILISAILDLSIIKILKKRKIKIQEL